MSASYLNAIKTRYAKQYASSYGEPKGCPEKDVAALEADLAMTLPAAYQEYLLWMGDDKGGILRGSEWFLSNVKGNTEALSELLSDNGLTLSEFDEPVCFFMHQGYMAAWFDRRDTADDPNCFFFTEAKPEARIAGPIKFTEFLAKSLSTETDQER